MKRADPITALVSPLDTFCLAMALTNPGSVPQHPPITSTPAETRAGTYDGVLFRGQRVGDLAADDLRDARIRLDPEGKRCHAPRRAGASGT